MLNLAHATKKANEILENSKKFPNYCPARILKGGCFSRFPWHCNERGSHGAQGEQGLCQTRLYLLTTGPSGDK
jgi:hypothetical protein